MEFPENVNGKGVVREVDVDDAGVKIGDTDRLFGIAYGVASIE